MRYYIIVNSFGNYAEILPMSVSGCLLASINFFNLIKGNNNKTIILSCIILFLILKYKIFADLRVIAFGGIIRNIGAILLFIIFFLIPINEKEFPILSKIIYHLTNYTQGIYSLHLIVKIILENKIDFVKKGQISGCILIYTICYFISFFCIKFIKRIKLFSDT